MKIIVISHGGFAKGAVEALEMITGVHEDVSYITMSDDVAAFEAEITAKAHGEDIIFLADLVGGHPFNTAFKLALNNQDNKNIVIGGFNLAILIEVVMLSMGNSIVDLKELVSGFESSSIKIKANF